jgi:elongation factor Ts
VELKSETDFVAKNPDFVNLANDLAALVAENGDDALAGAAERVDDLKINLRENIAIGTVVRVQAEAGQALDLYEHVQDGRVKNGVIVVVDGGTVEQAHDVAVHIAFARPVYLTRDEVPASEVEHERATYEAIARNEGKPEAALEKIVTGRLNGYFKDVALLDQPYVKDDKKTIAQYVSPGNVVRFAQVEIKGK